MKRTSQINQIAFKQELYFAGFWDTEFVVGHVAKGKSKTD